MATIWVKHWRLVTVILGIIALLWVLYALRNVLLPFGVGLVLAYIFEPAVAWVEKWMPPRKKPETRRLFATLTVLVVVFGVVGNVVYFLGRIIIDSSLIYMQHTPFYFTQALQNVQLWLGEFTRDLPPDVQQQIQGYLTQATTLLGTSVRQLIMKTVTSVPATVNTVLGFAALPFFLFYIMKDSGQLKKSFISVFTPAFAEHIRNIALIIEKVLGRYIRAQLMLGLIVGYFAFVGLLLLNIPFAPVLGILAGITEIIPTIGPWIGGGIAALITLAVAPDKILWVIVMFVGIQLTENFFLVPRVHSAYLRIHPAVMIVLLILGTYIAGFWGLLLVGPLTATTVEVYKYVHKIVDTEEPVLKVEVTQQNGSH
ncbi:MAG: AI-2E family transporter [Dehalococcoidales bacterium]|nr:AI-2E family transporter [Dehalococcoidales bacterium]